MGRYRKITLQDGRTLAYSEFGDHNGFPVINCHGGLVNRLDISWADAIAKKMKIRIISIDRPGIGYSSLHKDRTVIDWSNDVKQAIDQLDIKKFGVMGWSMGGQYALACAYTMPKRVEKLVLIASCLELSQRKNFFELNPMDKRFSRFAHKLPWLAWGIYAVMYVFIRLFPKSWRRLSAHQLGATDKSIISDTQFDFVTPTKEALRQPRGMIEEYKAFIKPWGFELEAINVSTSIWQGTEDKFVTYKWAEFISRHIPNSDLHMIENAGHFIAHQEIDNILSEFNSTRRNRE